MHEPDPEPASTPESSPTDRAIEPTTVVRKGAVPVAPPIRMPVLVVLRGAQVGRRYLLNEDSLVLGRNPERAHLVVAGDPLVSGAHCRFDRDPASDGWLLVDLSSTNGTLLRGDKVATAPITDGDRIQLGDTVLKFDFHDELEEEFHRQVDHLMNIDELTGLPVQRVFRHRFQDQLEVCGRRRRPLAVFMMDLDGLKAINDTHGHLLGGRSIAEVGRRLGAIVAEVRGCVSRFGGDEFSAFVPDLDRDRALQLGERLRAAVADQGVSHDDVTVRPTISIGIACFPDDGKGIDELVRKADAALYRAKAAGRNRVME